PGTYKIMAVIAGYRTFERTGVRINTQQFLALDIKLEIGTIEETITVVGESPFIDNTNASTGSIIDSKALESIPTAGRSLFLIPKLQNQPNVAEYWRDNGGGFGGPIVRNKTFFWSAGESYVDNQPQQNSFLVPTAAERNGDFSGLRRNGNAVVIRDPLTGQPFAGN